MLRIMLIDDNKIDLFVHRKIIEKCDSDVEIISFEKSTLAVQYLKMCMLEKDSSNYKSPDIILLDINMPFLDGFQVLEELEKIGYFNEKGTQVYMLSSSCSINDLSMARNYDLCSGYLSKPLNLEKFSQILLDKNFFLNRYDPYNEELKIEIISKPRFRNINRSQ